MPKRTLGHATRLGAEDVDGVAQWQCLRCRAGDGPMGAQSAGSGR
jgi:hypothetical protein